jgi:TorA maturation chaperone TorD
MNATCFSHAALERLATADLLLLLSAFFKRPHNVRLRIGERSFDAQGLVLAAGFPVSSATALGALAALIEDLDVERWTAEYNRLFESGVACPPYETTYIRRDKGGIIADIQGFYTAFGLRPSPAGAERPDHIACELDFLALLLVMSETARQKGDAEQAGIASDAARSFVRDHLSEWVPPFCDALEQATVEPLFAALARALHEVCRETVLSLGLEPLAASAVCDGKPDDDEPRCGGEPADAAAYRDGACPIH